MDIAANAVDGGEWSSFNGGGCEMEESDFMAQFFANCLLPNEGDGSFGFCASPTRWIGHESMTAAAAGVDGGSFDSSDTCHSELTRFYREGNYSDTFGAPYPTLLQESYCCLSHSSTMPPFDFFTPNAEGAAVDQGFPPGTRMAEEGCLYQGMSNRYLEASGAYLAEPTIADKHLQLKSDSQAFDLDPPGVEDRRSSDSSNALKKRPRASYAEGKRNQKSRKIHKPASCDNNQQIDDYAPLKRHSSASCSSGDDSNECQDTSGGATSCLSSLENKTPNSKANKKRASQGSATDPQSLYARKRRERINERLRILQNLIPNGTKVDISTMLEEAVQYVKFLQHQIKMLSSDDLWMYAAIAYNGMNLGSDLKLNAPAN